MSIDFNGGGNVTPFNKGEQSQRIDKLKAKLTERADDLVSTIFPRARIYNNEARIGNIDGDAGESLSIDLLKGVWIDHANDDRGDLITLWMKTRGCSFSQAVDELEQWGGLTKTPSFASPVAKLGKDRKAKADKDGPIDHSLGAPVASYHYKSPDGSLIAIMRRYHLATLDERGRPKKTFRPTTANGENRMPDPRPLYRLDKISTASEVILVEGEKCADALEQVGREATTQMGGAQADPAKTDWTPLAGKHVRIWQDNDPSGQGLARRITPFLEAVGATIEVLTIPPGKPPKWDAADAVADGDDLDEILAPQNKIPALRFRIMTIAELANIKPPEWRIDGIFPTHGASTIYGAYESYKTWIALDMLLSIATGKTWHGREVKPATVLYIAGEGQHGLAHRVVGWCSAKNEGAYPERFLALPEAVAVPALGEMDHLLRAIDAMADKPEIIALDTITRMSGGGSLNDEKDMQAYVRGMDRLRLHVGGHVMNIGHSGKDAEKGLLGSIVLPAAMETIIQCCRSVDTVTLCNSNGRGKQKDGPNFEDIKLAARKVEFERDGKIDTTLVFVPDEPVVKAFADPRKGLGALQKKVLEAVAQAAVEGQTLGFMRLKMMAGCDDSALTKTLSGLVSRGLIIEIQDENGRQWAAV